MGAIVLCFITETVKVKIKPLNSRERRTESATVSMIVVETTTSVSNQGRN